MEHHQCVRLYSGDTVANIVMVHKVVCNVYPWSTTSADRNTLCFSLGKIPTLYRYTVYFLNSAHVHCVLDGKDFHFLTLNLGSWQGVTIHSLYCIFSVHDDCWRVDHMAESGEMNVSHRNFSGNSVCVCGGGGWLKLYCRGSFPLDNETNTKEGRAKLWREEEYVDGKF